jgi:HK97 gp10 family phage protein
MTTVTIDVSGLESLVGGDAAKLEEAASKGLMAIALMVQGDAQRRILDGPKTGRVYKRGKGFHQASAPGESPANDLGALVQSIKASAVDRTEVQVVADAKYAAFLEYGTRAMEARPYMRPAAEKISAKGAEIIEKFVRATAAK